jgi:ceramide glucosyltransferase
VLIFLVLGWAFCGLALCGTAYAMLAARLAGRFIKKPLVGGGHSAAVSLLKPLHGGAPGLAENLESFCRQNYAGPVQIVFGVQDPADPSIPIVEALKARFPTLEIALVLDDKSHGPNAKISNLTNIMAAARHDLLILSDDDIAVPPDWLAAVTRALEAPGIGLVTCLYTGATLPGANLWSVLSAMGNSYDFLPNAILGASLGLANPCFGSTIALRREVLDCIGGFAAFADYLADDYEIGRAVREKGFRIAIPALSVRHGCREDSLKELFRHELRWTRTIRLLNRGGHLGSIVTLPLPLAILGAVFLGFAGIFSLFGGLIIGAAVASRLFLKWRIDAIFGANAGSAWLLPLRDLLSFVVFLASLFGGTVHWRGTRFAVQASGAMTRS